MATNMDAYKRPDDDPGKIGAKFLFGEDRKENVDPNTCPLRIIFENQELYRVALMSPIRNQASAVKFHEVIRMGSLDQMELPILQINPKLHAFQRIMSETLAAGFRRCNFDQGIYGYVLQFHPDIEQFLIDTAKQSFATIQQEYRANGTPAVTFETHVWRRLSRNVQKILNQFCERRFYNGPSIAMGNACMDLGVMQNEYCSTYAQTGFRQSAEPLGGSAHGSNYNTRVAYMNAVGTGEYAYYENVLNDEFDYFDQDTYDLMENYLGQGIKCPSTTFTHDFGATYSSLMTIVGEAKSGSHEAEALKLVLGCCRILNYSPIAYGMLLTQDKVRIYQCKRVDSDGAIHVKTFDDTYCVRSKPRIINNHRVRPPRNRKEYMQGVLRIIHNCSSILSAMEPHVPGMPALAGAWDFAAAYDVNWHGGDVPEWYYEFYRGTEMMYRYPAEMQQAVQDGTEKMLQAQASDDILGDSQLAADADADAAAAAAARAAQGSSSDSDL